MKTIEEILAEWTHTYPEIKKYVIKAMEAYASQQIEKYKELIKAQDEMIQYQKTISLNLANPSPIHLAKLCKKIKQLKTKLGL